MNFLDVDYYRNKIERQFNLIDKTNQDDVLPSIAVFFDSLCEDPIILSMLSQILNTSNKLEEFFKEAVQDVSKILNTFIIECVKEVKQLGPLKELYKFETRDWKDVNKDTPTMLPYIIIWTNQEDLTEIEKELNSKKYKGYEYLVSRFIGLKNVASHFDLDMVDISLRVESSYKDWKKPSIGYIELFLLHFNNKMSREDVVNMELRYKAAFDKLKTMVDMLKYVHATIEIFYTRSAKTDLLELVASLNYRFPYLSHVKKLVDINPSILEYGEENRVYIQHKQEKVIYYDTWKDKLSRILTRLYTLIDSTWYVNALLDRYLTKIREYGWARLARLAKEQDLSIDEKLLQFDLAEYLFDHGITTVVEKESGPDRLDIMTFDQSNTLMEVKLFRKIDDLTHVFQGVAQTLKYAKSHGKTVGYYVVFQSCKFNSLELAQEFTIGGVTIFLLLIDITGINGRDDTRARIDLNYNELHSFISFKDKKFIKQWRDVTLAHLLLIKGIGSTTARNLIFKKNEINNLEDLKGVVNNNQFEELKKYIQF